MKSKIYDKESNNMLNLLTLTIMNKEVRKELYEHKIKLFDFGAELAVGISAGHLALHALNYWVFKHTNIP